jgi:hypothetical protein
MVCKRYYSIVSAAVLFLWCICGCSQKKRATVYNTFYVQYVNLAADSFTTALASKTFGKVSFYKDGKLEVLSQNYLTEDYPQMHFYADAAELGDMVTDGARKIRIEFKGVFSLDSVEYSMQKYQYSARGWKKISDMGDFKLRKKFVQPKNIIADYVQEIVNNLVEYTYN